MRKVIAFFFYAVFGFALFNWIGWPLEFRFEDSHRNYFFIAGLCSLLPILLFIKVIMSNIDSKLLLASLSSICLSFFCLIVGYFAYSDGLKAYERGTDGSFEVIDEVTFEGFNYKLYRTNGGATTSYGLVLREEYQLAFGVKAVGRIFEKYKASDARIYLDGSILVLVIQPYSQDESVQTVSLKI